MWGAMLLVIAAPALLLSAAVFLGHSAAIAGAASATVTVGPVSDTMLTASSYLTALARGGSDAAALTERLNNSIMFLEAAAPGPLTLAAQLVASATHSVIDGAHTQRVPVDDCPPGPLHTPVEAAGATGFQASGAEHGRWFL